MNGNMFSERLRLVRKKRGLCQKDISEKLGLNKTAITAYETGAKLPKLTTACLLADVLGTSIDYLIGRVDEDGIASDKHCQQKTIILKSGGKLTLSAEIDTPSLSSKDTRKPLSKDWSFIHDMVDRLDLYAGETESAEDG